MATEPAIKSPLLRPTVDRRRNERQERSRDPFTIGAWLLVAVGVLGVALVVVLASGMRPGYDAFGWMVWGKQVLHWNLNTDGAPSWKPLPFLFTLPYGLFGAGQVWLWMVTAVGGALAGCVFAARIAYMLTGPCARRPYAPYVAGAVAGVGLLGLDTYSHLVLIASSDPIIVTLCLAAIDCHLSERPKLAFAMLVLASLGRPEAWPFLALYAIWAWFRVPAMRVLAVVGLALIPAFWFIIPALTSKSWFISGNLALRTINAVNVIHGSKFVAILDRLRLLNGWPIEVAAVIGFVIAAVRRDLVALALVAAGCLWTAIEIGLALHGWSGANRYLLEPAAVAIVIAGYAAGRVLAFAPQPQRDHGALRTASVVGSIFLVALLVGSLIPTGKRRVSTARSDITEARFAGRQIVRLQGVIAKDGGASEIRSCGQPVTLVGLQSKLAWAVGLNVGNVGFRPGKSIDSGKPIVFFKPHLNGWEVRPIHIAKADASRCAALRRDSAF